MQEAEVYLTPIRRNAQIGVMHNGASGGIAGNAINVTLKSLYDRLDILQYSKNPSTVQQNVGHP